MPKILCAGLIAADLVFETAALPQKGSKARANTSRLITGGGALNAASAIASLGGDASLCGAVGDDVFGQFLRQKMRDRGIDDTLVSTIPDVPTSRSSNVITSDGDRTIINHRDARLVPSAPATFAFDAALVDTRFPKAAAEIVKSARENDKPAVIDAEAPVADAIEALENASHIIFSEQGLENYRSTTDADALARVAIELGCWCAVTRGSSSVLCHDGKTPFEVPTIPTQALNTLGAGDVWHGAFTLALSIGKTELDAVKWANAAAALKVSRPVHNETLPTAQKVTALLAQNEIAMA